MYEILIGALIGIPAGAGGMLLVGWILRKAEGL